MEWQFYEQDNEKIVERRVPKLLGIDQLRSLGFKNSWEINRAILANFAINTPIPLSFSPMTFVHLKIDPNTWTLMRLPKYIFYFLITTVLFPLSLWFYISGLPLTHTEMLRDAVLVFFFAVIPWVLLCTWIWGKLYPQFFGNVVYRFNRSYV